MIQTHKQSGFTAVELLITLFVAAAFLIASYQLFNLVIKDGGATRAESRAANVAYDYLRKYAASSTTIPCAPSIPLDSAPISIDGLSNATATVSVSCPSDTTTGLSKVDVSVTYNVPAQTVEYSMFTSSTGSGGPGDITDGLVAWWKLNGDSTTAVGSPNGVINDAVPASHDGVPNIAYSFNGTSASINTNSTFSLGAKNVTISCWVWSSTASNSGAYVKVGDETGGYGIGIGGARFDNAYAGTKLVMLYENVRWIATTTDVGTGWHHVVMVIDGTGKPTAYLDGTAATGIPTGNAPIAPSGSTYIGNSNTAARFYKGSIDDVRLYNRPLSIAEINALYTAGAQ